MGLMASVGLIATVSHISSERPSPPAVGGGAPGAVAALQGVGAAARGLLSPTTTESLVGRVLHGGMPGLGGRFGAPIEPKTTATTPHTTSRSTGRPDIRRTTWSLGLTTVATPFASGRTRVTSTRFPTAKTTVKTHRKSTDKRDRLGNMHLNVGTSVTYGEPTTGHSKTSAKWRIVREPSVMSLVGSRSSTKQPSNVLPVFAEEPSKVSLTRGQQPDTTAVAMETSDAPVKPPNEVYHTTAAETHETNFKEIGLALDTTSSRYKITEVLETEATTGAVNHANSRAVTNPYNQKEYATFTDRIAELTTGDIFGGGRADQYAKQPHVTGSGQIHQRGTTATTQATDAVRSTRGVPHAAVSTAPITATGENTHQLGEATIYGTGEDSSDYPGEVKADTEVTEVSGSVTLSSSKPGDVTTWSPSVIQRTRQDTTDAATVLSSEPNDDDTVVRPTRNPKGKTTQPAMSSFQTDSFNPIKTTNDDRPSTMIPSYRRTPQRISDGTTADTLIKHTPHHPTLATETTYNTKETPPPVVGATADDPTMNETGETVTREGGPSTTDEFTSQAIVTSTSREREDTVPSATLSQSYSSRSMSPLRRLKDIDRTDAWRPVTSPSVVPIEVTAENNEEERSSTSSVVSPSDIDNNDNLYSPSTHKKLSSYTSTHAPFSHNNADTTPLTSAGSRTTHEPLYRSTNSYAQREHTSPDAHDGSVSEVKSGTPLHQSSSVAFVIKPSTDSLSTTLTPSKHSDSTTDMSVQMPHVPGTRTALHERTSSDEPVSMTATYPGTTDKTTVDRPGYKRHLPTTGRDPYTGHVTETQHTGSTQNNIVSKIPSPTDESSTETTMDTGNTEDVRSLMTTHAVNLTRSAINADAVIRPATANMTQGKHSVLNFNTLTLGFSLQVQLLPGTDADSPLLCTFAFFVSLAID